MNAPVRLTQALLLALSLFSLGCTHHGHHRNSKPMTEYRPGGQLRQEIVREIDLLEKSKDVVVIGSNTTALSPARLHLGEAENLADLIAVAEVKRISFLEKPPTLIPSHPSRAVEAPAALERQPRLTRLSGLEASDLELSEPNETPLIFDIPVTYNDNVRKWIRYFQTDGRSTFKNWLQRSTRYLPVVQQELSAAGLPQDLAFVAMIESGFTPSAVSHAGAKGMWQFIVPTARRYGLKIDWWIDERKDFHKATQAAIQYMRDLYQQFHSWYLVAASYNMGENGVRRLIERHQTTNFWELAAQGVLPLETTEYVPKIIAAMLIAKAPGLYGFRDLDFQLPLEFEIVSVPGGTDMINLASFLGVSERYMKDLNPELNKGFVPTTVRRHPIRVPRGSFLAVSQFIRLQVRDLNRTAAN